MVVCVKLSTRLFVVNVWYSESRCFRFLFLLWRLSGSASLQGYIEVYIRLGLVSSAQPQGNATLDSGSQCQICTLDSNLSLRF